jgi:hypothetical protein
LWNSQINLDEEHDANDVNIDVNDRRTAVHQLRHPNPHPDLRNVPGRSAPVAHAAILDAHTDRRRCAEVFTGRGPMTVDAIQRSPPRHPESRAQGGFIDLETHESPPRWGQGIRQGLVPQVVVLQAASLGQHPPWMGSSSASNQKLHDWMGRGGSRLRSIPFNDIENASLSSPASIWQNMAAGNRDAIGTCNVAISRDVEQLEGQGHFNLNTPINFNA